jgi:hypothetical protein
MWCMLNQICEFVIRLAVLFDKRSARTLVFDKIECAGEGFVFLGVTLSSLGNYPGARSLTPNRGRRRESLKRLPVVA